MENNIIIKCKDVSFTYPDGHKALSSIYIDVRAGEKIAITGPNGAGKSTLLLQINGILRGNGEISVCGMPLSDGNLNHIRRKVGLVFQDPNDQLFCPTVFDDVAFGPLHFGMRANEVKNLVVKSLSDVGLECLEKKSGHHLSLGEKKRIAIATVFACRPDIMLLDEPTANLDPRHRREMINMITNWNYTTIIATHDLDLAWDTCPRCIVLNGGEIKADGPSKDILRDRELLAKNDLEMPLRFQG